MTTWLFIGLSTLGLVVLGAAAMKVFLALRGLAHELERTRRRLGVERFRAGEGEPAGDMGQNPEEEISWREERRV